MDLGAVVSLPLDFETSEALIVEDAPECHKALLRAYEPGNSAVVKIFLPVHCPLGAWEYIFPVVP